MGVKNLEVQSFVSQNLQGLYRTLRLTIQLNFKGILAINNDFTLIFEKILQLKTQSGSASGCFGQEPRVRVPLKALDLMI